MVAEEHTLGGQLVEIGCLDVGIPMQPIAWPRIWSGKRNRTLSGVPVSVGSVPQAKDPTKAPPEAMSSRLVSMWTDSIAARRTSVWPEASVALSVVDRPSLLLSRLGICLRTHGPSGVLY